MADRINGPDTPGPKVSGGRAPGDVISLHTIAQDARFPVVTKLEAYWQGLRGTRLLPARAEVDPRHIEDTLEYAFIAERIAPGMARFRLAGLHLNDLMGMEVRGMPVSAFFTPDARKPLSEAMEHVFDDPAIVRMELKAETGIGRPAIDARLLLLPLKSDFGDVSRALGCMVTMGSVGRTPRRFSIASTEVDAIAGPEHAGDRRISGWSKGLRNAQPGARPQTETRVPEPGLAEAPAPFEGSTASRDEARATPTASGARPDGRPNLYIVHSSD